ncbi:MAG: recombinase RecT, partial [Polyangiaceae bacterium]|nr:recombinase RecT [Polyangiaceae bacterium]
MTQTQSTAIQKPKNNGKQSTAIVSPKQERLDRLRDLFEQAKGGLSAVLPKHLPAEKVIRLTLSAASRTPELLECTRESILLASMQAAALGLEPNTPLGLAYLIPYRTKRREGNREITEMQAQFIPGYRGLITLAIQSGDVKSVQADVVYKDDFFEYERGLEPKLRHVPAIDGSREDIIAAYSVAVFTNGHKTFEVMFRADIEKIRKRSKAGNFGPWVTDYPEMVKKTVIRRHSKGLPLSPERAAGFARALDAQGRAEAGDAPDYTDVITVLPEPEAV